MAALQEGISHAPGQRPGAFFTILFLRAAPACTAAQVGQALGELWRVYQGLKAGNVRELPGHPVPAGALTVLVGYGPKAFALTGAGRPLPADLGSQSRFRSPLPTGGGPLLVGSGLRYGDDVRANLATEEIAVQLIADTQLATSRAVVETWRTLAALTDPRTGMAPLLLTSFYSGFQRDDGRSWIDFHDGVSNMDSREREGAIAIKPSGTPEDGWTEGGSYLAFVRVAVDLASWDALTRDQQELLVGRDKLTGCPLRAVGADGRPVVQPGCPVAGTGEAIEPGVNQGNQAFREPAAVSDPVVRQSHVQRANHHERPVNSRNSLRVYRQGYEFLESLEQAPGLRPGLNFVSFQDTPERLFRMLTQATWLGRTNFGGDPDRQLPGIDRLLTVRAAGVYLAPPVVDGEPFPGATILLGQ
ncbi:MAG: Dyp-type peroxidase [Egibacteraceae bacterium]